MSLQNIHYSESSDELLNSINTVRSVLTPLALYLLDVLCLVGLFLIIPPCVLLAAERSVGGARERETARLRLLMGSVMGACSHQWK